MDFDLFQIVLYIAASLIGAISTGGGVSWYLKRDLELRFNEREAAIEDQKSENETFADVVKVFHLTIVNQAEQEKERIRSQESVATERNRIQSQMMTDFREFATTTLQAMNSLKDEITSSHVTFAQSTTEIIAEQQRHGLLLDGLMNTQKESAAKLVAIAEKLETAFQSGITERKEILDLLKQLINQAKAVSQEASEMKSDLEAAEISEEASQK